MSASQHDIVSELVARCHSNPAPLSPWEADFLDKVAGSRRPPSRRQFAILERIAIRIAPSEIALTLAEHAEALATHLVGAPPTTRTRDECRYRRRGSLSVIVTGPDRGWFFDNEAGVFGDMLHMIGHLRHEPLAEALKFAKAWLRIEGTGVSSMPPRPPAEVRKAAPPKSTAPLARSIWAEAVPAAGTLVERYLASRDIVLPPDAPLRFHPACPRGSERLPAMIALMTHPATNEPLGVHRTYLWPDGTGKADGQAKMMLGDAGVIRLVPDEEVDVGLGLAEGVETGLSVMAAGWRPVWACGSAGGIAGFPVLPGIEALTIFADADAAGTKAARTCAARWAAAGREVTVHCPRGAGSDWADVVRGIA